MIVYFISLTFLSLQSLSLVLAANRTIQKQKKEISALRKENYWLKETIYETKRIRSENKHLKEEINEHIRKEFFYQKEAARREHQAHFCEIKQFYVTVGSRKTSIFGRVRKFFGRVKRVFRCKKVAPMFYG